MLFRSIVRPEDNVTFDKHSNVIAGNVTGFGATSGQMFVANDYLKGNTLPTVDELLQQKPVVGRVVGSNGDVICEP